MKITVLSGSPKGETSVSLQYLKFIAKNIKDVNFEIFHLGKKIELIEKQAGEFEKIMSSVKESDGVIWVFPVYHFLVPSQLKKFIELIFGRDATNIFKDKYATSIITSIHFYDTIAENYIHAISEDLGMNYVKGFLADMNDLKSSEKQRDLKIFGEIFYKNIIEKRITSKVYNQELNKIKIYSPSLVSNKGKTNKYKIVLVTDNGSKNGNLKNMIETFMSTMENSVEIVNLDELKTTGACLGCCRCGYEGECIYKDDMTHFLKGKFLDADAIVIASDIKDRYLSYAIKRMWDRSFSHGHRPVLRGKKMLYIVAGPLSQNNLIRDEIEARSSVSGIYMVDIINDEFLDSEKLTIQIEQAGKDLIDAISEKRSAQENFYSVAGHKIFRDFVYTMKFVFNADNKYYKKIKYYDFPKENIVMWIANRVVPLLLKRKKIREEFNKRIESSMVDELKKIAESR